MITIALTSLATVGLVILCISHDNWYAWNEPAQWAKFAVMLWGATAVVLLYVAAFLALP